ncbi:hypothetical protein C1X89_34075 [Pseudomonas sp. GP01-A8]|nr:hypothetical protein C1X90_34245 [Pseudomonas sp. GP01-A9]PMU15049.1 hypothetical protein C1X88_34020 [Pseudomonas sp. GP01-A13]PMU30000.1 hypothetical protein C1X89_34075 [Pseudomonas sp. GP01-A8]PMU39885.1 hypothetical protein C1X87_32945 [Pseudomonas sp. GP01-A14]PMU46375.1 hypothetical protein C1X85_34305 [Pseudomonas sp. GP01-A6]PMU58418.1 hypothetical protein C1X86_33950 [Pseudomonas sp. GP01-A3]PMU65237.1 hypothetical protein C1X81_33675 [Pseudomonas sp. FW215-L2]PMU65593.1 hypothe
MGVAIHIVEPFDGDTGPYTYMPTGERRTPMPNSDLLPSLLSKLYENQLALEASIMELSNWVREHGLAVDADLVSHDRPPMPMAASSSESRSSPVIPVACGPIHSTTSM